MKASTQKLVNEIVALTFTNVKGISITVTSFSEINQVSVSVYSLEGQLYTSYVLLKSTDADTKLRETLTAVTDIVNKYLIEGVA